MDESRFPRVNIKDRTIPANKYLLKVNNKNYGLVFYLCSELTMKVSVLWKITLFWYAEAATGGVL